MKNVLVRILGMGRDITTPGICNIYVRAPWANYPVLLGDIGVYTASGNSRSLQVFNKQQPAFPDQIRDTQKMDTSADRKLPDDQDSPSIFIKVIDRELSHGSSSNLYSRCWMDLASNVVQTEAPHFVELRLPAINTLDEVCILGTPETIIRRPTDGSHWSVPNNFFGEAIAVGMSATR